MPTGLPSCYVSIAYLDNCFLDYCPARFALIITSRHLRHLPAGVPALPRVLKPLLPRQAPEFGFIAGNSVTSVSALVERGDNIVRVPL